MMRLLTWFSTVFWFSFRSKNLRDYEKICLEAWQQYLSDAERKKLDAQLLKLDFIQRQAGKTKTVFFDFRDFNCTHWPAELLFKEVKENHLAFRAVLVGKVGDVKLRVSFKVFLHKGRLFSIEFDSEVGAISRLSREDMHIDKAINYFASPQQA